MAGFLAYIMPIDQSNVPTHPIAPGGPPPGVWPGPGPLPHPEHPIAPGGQPPHPAHPIAPGGQPPGTWGGAGEPFPTPPIVIPPQQPGQPPLVIWGPNDPRPTPPIEIPGVGQPPPGGDKVQLIEWKTAWTPNTGWVVVGVPQVPHPAPAAKK